MCGEVQQIHKSDYRAACSLALSLSMQQPHFPISFLKLQDYWILTTVSLQLHVPSHYSRKHFKEETLLLSVHEVLRYLSSAFQPLFPRERIKGYKVLDQLHDTTKGFPMLALHCKFLVVSTLWSSPSQKELLRQPQCKMRSILGGYRDCTADVLLSRIQDVTGPPPPPPNSTEKQDTALQNFACCELLSPCSSWSSACWWCRSRSPD